MHDEHSLHIVLNQKNVIEFHLSNIKYDPTSKSKFSQCTHSVMHAKEWTWQNKVIFKLQDAMSTSYRSTAIQSQSVRSFQVFV